MVEEKKRRKNLKMAYHIKEECIKEPKKMRADRTLRILIKIPLQVFILNVKQWFVCKPFKKCLALKLL